MNNEFFSTKKVVMVNTLAIILAAAIAMIAHAAVPAGVDAEKFDGLLVKLFGFPVVAVAYFLLLFLHCVVTMRYFGKKSNVPKMQIGFRFGLAFAILYFFGMQEVVVEASPFEEWGSAFVSYQFFMGVSDAMPALLLCMTVAHFTLNNFNTYISAQSLSSAEKIKAIALIAVAFLFERAIGYETGIITSNCHLYPVPCYLWTLLFGIVLGCSYVVLYPIYAEERNELLMSVKLVIFTIGLNWIIFNSFIGLIFSGSMPQALLRSGMDVAVFFLSATIINVYLKTCRQFIGHANLKLHLKH